MSGRELVECRRVNARILQVYGAAFGQDSADGRVVQVGEPVQQCRVGCRICRHYGAQLWIGGDDLVEVFWGGCAVLLASIHRWALGGLCRPDRRGVTCRGQG